MPKAQIANATTKSAGRSRTASTPATGTGTSDAAAEDRLDHVLDPARVITFDPGEAGPKSTLAVRLNGADIDRLRGAAERAGVGVTQLARQWLTERLAIEEQKGAAGTSSARPALVEDIAELLAVAERLRVQVTHLTPDDLSATTAKRVR